MSAIVSLLGLFLIDPHILDDLHIPTELSTNTMTNLLLTDCAEFEILYPDPDFLRGMIDSWSASMLPIWQKLYNTTILNYDPISNYDRNEEWTDNNSSTRTDRSTSNSNSDSDSRTTSSQQGYNRIGMVDSGQTVNHEESGASGTYQGSSAGTTDAFHKGHSYGNIGVTTTQEMIRQEREIAVFNIYQRISDDFRLRFCLMVY